jgi:crossover junction endodeoxyribonuclease RusA
MGMSRAVKVELPWLGSEYSAHAKGHWRKKHAITKKARGWARVAAQSANVPSDHNARLVFAFHPPVRGGLPDCHNMANRVKAYIDGIADAMGVDDRKFRVRFPEELSERKGDGLIVVTVET